MSRAVSAIGRVGAVEKRPSIKNWDAPAQLSLAEPQYALAPFWITELLNVYLWSQPDVAHILRSDQNVLYVVGGLGRVCDHLHRDAAIDGVHEHVELVKTPQRASDGFPERQQEADRREGLLATRK